VLQIVFHAPGGLPGESTCADVQSLRRSFRLRFEPGHDSIVVYRINQRTGRLTYVGHQSTQENSAQFRD